MTGPSTGVLLVGWSLTTRTFVRVTLPALLTVPLKFSTPPGGTGLTGQCFVTARRGVATIGHPPVLLSLIIAPLQPLILRAVIVSVVLVMQVSSGTRYEPVKPAVSPGASVIGPNTGVLLDGWLLMTVTLIRVMFPALLTTPEKTSRPPSGT